MAVSDLTIKTERLILRPFEKPDLEQVLSYYSLPDVQRYLDWKARDKSEAKSAFESMCKQTRLTRPGEVLTLAIVRKSDGKVMGHVSLRYTDSTAAQGEIRFAIGPTFRKKGYASEAVKAVVSFGFEEFRLHRICARTAGQNEASARLCEIIGMHQEALLRQTEIAKGEWADTAVFAILEQDFRSGR